jgi:hypothetical protein
MSLYDIIRKVYPRSFQNSSSFIPDKNVGPRVSPEISLPHPKTAKMTQKRLYFKVKNSKVCDFKSVIPAISSTDYNYSPDNDWAYACLIPFSAPWGAYSH